MSDDTPTAREAALCDLLAAIPDYFEPKPLVEDWLPLGRGGDRRAFNSLDEYFGARLVWLRMSRHEREAHLVEREKLSSKDVADE